MPIKKYITAMSIVTVLHLSGGALSSLLSFGSISGDCASAWKEAWAEESASGTVETPVTTPTSTNLLQEKKELPTSCDEPAEPEPLEIPAEEEKPPPPGIPDLGKELKKVPGFIELLHGELSREILATATRFDSFFGDERYVLEDNRSYVRVRLDVFKEEGADILFRPAVDLRMALPQLEKKAHIVFTAEPTTTPEGTGTLVTAQGEEIATTGQTVTPAEEPRNLAAALMYFFRSRPGESIIIRTGFQLSKGNPVVFAAPRYRSLTSLGVWDLRFTQEVLYRTDTEWRMNSIVDIERKLPHDLFFRASANGVWFSEKIGYFYSVGFSLRQALGATHALDYEWINSYQTRPVHELMDVAFRIRYRHSFWREWLFYEIAPQIRYPRERSFDDTPGILFRLEIFFGRQAA